MAKFKNFLEIVKECNINTSSDFSHFMSVIKEHCLDKGITDYKSIMICWQSHKNSLKNIVKHIDDFLKSHYKN